MSSKPSSGEQMRSRKEDHIRICLDDEASQFDLETTGFEAFAFTHDALPEMAPEDVDLSSELFGKKMSAPLIVSSMTGGPVEGAKINRHLAEGVHKTKLGMAVGSQRIAIVQPETRASFEVRTYAPDVPLFANLGAVQLNYGFGAKEAREAVEMIGADALFLHLNALQEVVQPEGDTNFRGLFEKIGALARTLPFPVFVKECGCGISADVAEALASRGVSGIDVSGAGGTSWSKVEAHRTPDPRRRALGETFGNWGIPTATAIADCRKRLPGALLIASGGIRDGVDVAKAIALGADLVGIARPVLDAALESGDAVRDVLDRIILELRTVCFLVGARSVADLRNGRFLRRRGA